MPTLTLRCSVEDMDFYVASLARGILEGMLSGAISLDVGIWSLGRPIFRTVVQKASTDPGLVAALDAFDELSAMSKLDLDVREKIRLLIDGLDATQGGTSKSGTALAIYAEIKET